ncbi:MAG: hydrogenase maturation protease [Euryarchaeota archaeon]|nr:hydrogenase maturation protease [Euryarchaeota archaeon]
MKKRIAVIGLGNPLRRDDAIGILLLQYLSQNKKKLSKTIDFIDGGTSGMNLLHLLGDYETVLLLDAVDFKGSTGEIKKFTVDEIKNQKIQLFLSTHEPDFLTVYALLKELDRAPTHLIIFGVQPKDISYGTRVSQEICSFLPTLQKQILEEIQSMTKSL